MGSVELGSKPGDRDARKRAGDALVSRVSSTGEVMASLMTR